jgi:hypothetical protein
VVVQKFLESIPVFLKADEGIFETAYVLGNIRLDALILFAIAKVFQKTCFEVFRLAGIETPPLAIFELDPKEINSGTCWDVAFDLRFSVRAVEA